LKLLSGELSTVPGFQHVFSRSFRAIIRADLLRYTLLWRYGGFYADVDVTPVCAVDACRAILPLFNGDEAANTSLVIGIELDEPYASARRRQFWRWDNTYGFLQYTMYAPKPFSPILRRAIVYSIANSIGLKRENRPWYDFSDKFDRAAILEVTGPGMFTQAVMDVLSETLSSVHWLKTVERQKDLCPVDGNMTVDSTNRVTWAPFYRLKETLWIKDEHSEAAEQDSGGLAVLPVNVWGNGQRHSGAENFGSSQACVNHHFAGTWKKSWLHRTLLQVFDLKSWHS
jgi:hypothetical protein